jgi:hypothetical protein
MVTGDMDSKGCTTFKAMIIACSGEDKDLYIANQVSVLKR